MNRATRRIQDKLLARARKGANTAQHQEIPINVHHGHNLTHAWFRIDPPPQNGIVQFTLDQYRKTIEQMTICADSLEKQQKGLTTESSRH